MVRLFVIIVAVAVVLEIFAVVDAALAERSRIRGLPKPVWFIVIVLVPLVGALLWFFLGRPRRGDGGRADQPRRQAGGNRRRSSPRPSGPDDDPDFLRRLQRDLDKGLDKDDDSRE
jgi:hypothetical protein